MFVVIAKKFQGSKFEVTNSQVLDLKSKYAMKAIVMYQIITMSTAKQRLEGYPCQFLEFALKFKITEFL